MSNYDVYGVGNALVDTEYEVKDSFLESAGLPKGMMTLIDEEERQRLTGLLTKEEQLVPIKQASGGSAANTLVTLAQLGARVFYSCKVAADACGDFFMADLDSAGVDTNLTAGREEGTTGQCISMVTPDAERTMTTCLGITQLLSPGELDPDALSRSSHLYLEGYLIASPTAFEAMLRAQQLARSQGVKVALTLSDPSVVSSFKASFQALINEGVDLLFCNLDEARLLTGGETETECVRLLREHCPQFTVTLGSAGALSFDGKRSLPGTRHQGQGGGCHGRGGHLCRRLPPCHLPGAHLRRGNTACQSGGGGAGVFLWGQIEPGADEQACKRKAVMSPLCNSRKSPFSGDTTDDKGDFHHDTERGGSARRGRCSGHMPPDCVTSAWGAWKTASGKPSISASRTSRRQKAFTSGCKNRRSASARAWQSRESPIFGWSNPPLPHK